MAERNKYTKRILTTLMALASLTIANTVQAGNDWYEHLGDTKANAARTPTAKFVPDPSLDQQYPPRDREREEYPSRSLEVIKRTWSKGGFDLVSIFTVTFRNNTSRPIGNIKYNTDYFAETGEIVTRGGSQSWLGNQLIRRVIPAHSTRTLEINDGFVSDEAVSARFLLASWENM